MAKNVLKSAFFPFIFLPLYPDPIRIQIHNPELKPTNLSITPGGEKY
jgi:hypothetical protein